jgi:RimJ/RimL family protein N-acetyltransferase
MRIECQQEYRNLTLPNGVVIPVRCIRPEDAPALQRLYDRLSERSIVLRFFGSMKELSDQKAKYFAHVDGINRFALVALDPNEHNELIAVVRFDREADTDKAEYAALVEDSWQGHGLGLGLTRQLIHEARARGIHHLYGLVMSENRRMLKLLRSLDLPERERREGGIKRVEVKLVA